MWCIWMYLHPLSCPCWFYDFIWPTELIVSQSFKSYQYSYLRFLILWRFLLKTHYTCYRSVHLKLMKGRTIQILCFLLTEAIHIERKLLTEKNNEKILIYIISMHFSCALKQWGGGGYWKILKIVILINKHCWRPMKRIGGIYYEYRKVVL